MALVTDTVVKKKSDDIASAVTNLDLHDISGATKTDGVRSFYVITPLYNQKELVEKIISRWLKGTGARYNPKRREALKLITIKGSVDEVIEHIRKNNGDSPKTVVTSAGHSRRSISFNRFRKMLQDDNLYLLMFGTGWGLSEKFMADADYALDPVFGNTDYNHLSVRSAASVILDRLFGRKE